MSAADVVDRAGLRLVHARKVFDDIDQCRSIGRPLLWADAFLVTHDKTMPLLEFSCQRRDHSSEQQFMAAIHSNAARLAQRGVSLGMDPYFELGFAEL